MSSPKVLINCTFLLYEKGAEAIGNSNKPLGVCVSGIHGAITWRSLLGSEVGLRYRKTTHMS